MTKRTRHRRLKIVEPIVETDQTQLDLAELAVLWPRLEAALGRDGAGPSSESERSSGPDPLGSPAVINLDVQQARAEIAVGVAEIEAEVERLLKLDRRHRSTQAIIEALPDWYQQLRDRNQPLAKHIADDVIRWSRVARTALRLRTVEYRIGWLCPNHRDRPAELVKDADEATLHPSIIAGREPPGGFPPLTWRYAESVHCPRCKERWAGIAQLRTLMRMIEAANAADTERTTP